MPCHTCRFSAWAASAPAWTRCSSCSPAPSAVSVGTAVFGDPTAPVRVLAELEQALDERGFASLADAVGYAHRAGDNDSHGWLSPHDASASGWTPRSTSAGRCASASTRTRRCSRPGGSPDDADGLARFADTCVEAFAGTAAVIKPQSGLFEPYGSRGIAVLERTVAACRAAGALVVLDVKRGDIGTTMAGYARAYLDPAAPLACRRDHGQPLSRRRLARAGLRAGARARRRRLRARAHVQSGGAAGAARRAPRTAAPSPRSVIDELAARNAGARPAGSASASSSAPPSARSARASRRAQRPVSSSRASARRAARPTTCAASSARHSRTSSRACRARCCGTGPTSRRCGRRSRARSRNSGSCATKPQAGHLRSGLRSSASLRAPLRSTRYGPRGLWPEHQPYPGSSPTPQGRNNQ